MPISSVHVSPSASFPVRFTPVTVLCGVVTPVIPLQLSLSETSTPCCVESSHSSFLCNSLSRKPLLSVGWSRHTRHSFATLSLSETSTPCCVESSHSSFLCNSLSRKPLLSVGWSRHTRHSFATLSLGNLYSVLCGVVTLVFPLQLSLSETSTQCWVESSHPSFLCNSHSRKPLLSVVWSRHTRHSFATLTLGNLYSVLCGVVTPVIPLQLSLSETSTQCWAESSYPSFLCNSHSRKRLLSVVRSRHTRHSFATLTLGNLYLVLCGVVIPVIPLQLSLSETSTQCWAESSYPSFLCNSHSRKPLLSVGRSRHTRHSFATLTLGNVYSVLCGVVTPVIPLQLSLSETST